MELAGKEDWPQAQERWEAWWHGEVVDRAAIQVVAPKQPVPDRLSDLLQASGDMGFFMLQQHLALPGSLYTQPRELSEEELLEWFTDPQQVIPREEGGIRGIYWGGEAFPVVFPVSIFLVAITAAYLGCPYRPFPGSYSGWADPIIDDWEKRPELTFDPHNKWWRISKRLLEAAAERAGGRYYVSVPDLNGPGEILSRLRETSRLAMDLVEHPEAVKSALNEVNAAWLRYWEASVGVIHQWTGGYVYWMGIWSESPSIDLQCDFSCIISPEMFEEFFIPAIEQQTEWVGRTIYHLDGPDAVQHLDALLALPKLDGIQWVAGAGAPPTTTWIPVLKRVQAAGKLLVLYCFPTEVETLLTELEPEGLLLNVGCSSVEEAKALLKNVERWTARRRRVAT